MRVIKDLKDVQVVLREILDWKDKQETRHYSRHGLQIKETGAATDGSDVVILSQLESSIAAAKKEIINSFPTIDELESDLVQLLGNGTGHGNQGGGGQGAQGNPGPPGVGVPTGGSTGQALVKSSDSDYATAWATIPVTSDITVVFDGGGSAISVAAQCDVRIDFTCIISQWTILCDQTGSIVIDIWKDTLANYPPTIADSITAAAKPTVSSATNNSSTVLTGWNLLITAGDTLRFNIDSVATVQRASLNLKVTKQ